MRSGFLSSTYFATLDGITTGIIEMPRAAARRSSRRERAERRPSPRLPGHFY